MNHDRGLLSTVFWAVQEWWSRKTAQKQIKRWLNKGKVDLGEEPQGFEDEHLCIRMLRTALWFQAEEMLFYHRVLWGHRELENDPRFWYPDFEVGVDDYPPPDPPTEEDAFHFHRYAKLSRVEEWLLAQGKADLVTVFPDDVGKNIFSIFAGSLTKELPIAVQFPKEHETMNGKKKSCTVGPMSFRPHGIYFIPFQWHPSSH